MTHYQTLGYLKAEIYQYLHALVNSEICAGCLLFSENTAPTFVPSATVPINFWSKLKFKAGTFLALSMEWETVVLREFI